MYSSCYIKFFLCNYFWID